MIRTHPDKFTLEVITAWNSHRKLIAQAKEFLPGVVVIGNEDHYHEVRRELEPLNIKVYAGEEAIEQVTAMGSVEVVLNAIVGYAGFRPTLRAVSEGKILALANKESLVVGGELVARLAAENRSAILPVDSEHSAIFQCLQGESMENVTRIILTASGGPFDSMPADAFEKILPADALKHPNWEMGSKITVDSATMMNKGLEVIEAHWLFGLEPEKIEVIVHPQSIVHSLVGFRDGSVKAQLGLPDMRTPIIYALSYPQRLSLPFEPLDLAAVSELSFHKPDIKKFRNLALAFEALEKGGNTPCILNAANEIAVTAFLKGRIGFTGIPRVIEHCMGSVGYIPSPSLDDLMQSDRETRIVAENRISKI